MGVTFEVSRQASIATDPCKGTLDDPSLGQHDEAVCVAAPDNFDNPASCRCRSFPCLGALVAGIGEDALDEGEQRARVLIEDQCHAIAVLDIGGMDGDAQQETERVDEDMPLAPRDLLARVVA